MRIAIFVSGKGSNFKAILNSEKLLNRVYIVRIITDKPNCGAVKIADKNNIPIYFLDNKNFVTSYKKLSKILQSENIELIVLAGYLKLITSEFVSDYYKRIINIHPALLPLYGGKGMYGMNVHRAVLESGDSKSGATIHFVDENYDRGKIIAQEKINISKEKTAEDIAAKVLKIEHKLLPEVIYKISKGEIKIGIN